MNGADRPAALHPFAIALAAALSSCPAGCEPDVPRDKSQIEIVVRAASGEVQPGIVYVKLDPPGSPEFWAIETGGHLPAGRTIWVDETDDRVLRAAGFECPASGCASVDPETDTPCSVGHSSVSLDAGRSTRVVVHLSGSECGNSVVEPGEACDGAAGCGSDCTMPVSALAEAPGITPGGIAVLATGSGFTIAWLNDACGAAAAACLSLVSFDPGGDRVSTVESIEVGGTTGSLSTDRRRFVSWINTGDAPGDPGRVAALAPGEDLGIIDLGPSSIGGMAVPAVASSGAGDGPFVLALEPETGTLEIRWPGPASAAAGIVAPGTDVRSPSLATFPDGDGLSIAALWAVGPTGGQATAWYMRHWAWECASPPTGCVPFPSDTDAMPIGLPVPEFPVFALLEGAPGKEQILVSGAGGDIEARVFAAPGMPPDEPDVVAIGVTADGSTPRAMDAREGIGVAVLLIAPGSTGAACSSRVLLVPLDGSLPFTTASWDDRPSGCSGAVAMLEDGRTVAAWRGTSEDPGTSSVEWTIAPHSSWR